MDVNRRVVEPRRAPPSPRGRPLDRDAPLRTRGIVAGPRIELAERGRTRGDLTLIDDEHDAAIREAAIGGDGAELAQAIDEQVVETRRRVVEAEAKVDDRARKR